MHDPDRDYVTPEDFVLFNGIRDAAPDGWGRHLMDRAAGARSLYPNSITWSQPAMLVSARWPLGRTFPALNALCRGLNRTWTAKTLI